MSANDRQVGGNHYASSTGVQHWDWVTVNEMGYLEGNATKYVSRWRKKNGLQDLEKAIHYVDKLRETAERNGAVNRCRLVCITASKFASDAGLDVIEEEFCRLMLEWSCVQDIVNARSLIDEIAKDAIG